MELLLSALAGEGTEILALFQSPFILCWFSSHLKQELGKKQYPLLIDKCFINDIKTRRICNFNNSFLV